MHPGAGGRSPRHGAALGGGTLRQGLVELVEGGLSKREAARTLAERTGHSRRELYALLHQEERSSGP
jgi:16S rRNA (cytidine1402-2'-O)-methyltransferase